MIRTITIRGLPMTLHINPSEKGDEVSITITVDEGTEREALLSREREIANAVQRFWTEKIH